MEDVVSQVETIDKNSGSQENLQDTSNDQSTTEQWRQDKRAQNGMFKSPDDVYKSFKNLEKEYTQKTQKLSEYEKQVNELQEFKKTQEPYSDVIKYFQFLSSNEKYAGRLKEFIEAINHEEQLQRYGDLPPEMIQRIQQGEQAWEKLSKIEQEQQQAKEYQSQVDGYSKSLNEIEHFAKENDISWDQEDKQNFVEYCTQNGVSTPEQMMVLFFKQAAPALRKYASEQTESKVINNLKKSKNNSLPSSNRNYSNNGNKKVSLSEKLDNFFSKVA